MTRAKKTKAAGGRREPNESAVEVPWPRPTTEDELHAWLRTELKVDVPREAIVAGHAPPFAYVAHAFFHDHAPNAAGPGDCVVWANRGGGKTFLGAVATLLDLVFKPGIEIRILAGSMEQAQRMHAHLRRLFKAESLASLIDGRVTERKIALVNGSGVELLSQSQASVRGTRVQKLRCDEVELFTRDVWEAAQLVTRSARCGDVSVRGTIECFSTMHVPHGLMQRLVDEASAGTRRLFRWGVVDVLGACDERHACERVEGGEARRCALWEECGGKAKARAGNAAGIGVGHLTVDDAVRMKRRVAGATWDAEMLCLRPKRTDAVLPEFDPRAHVVERLPWEDAAELRPELWVGGMDFGFRAPTVVLWGAVDAEDRLWIVRERSEVETVLEEHVKAITAGPELEWIGVDPAGHAANDQTGLTAIKVMRDAGLTVRARKSRVAEGLAKVRARLKPADGGPPRLFVHRSCVKLIESLERYHYPEHQPESTAPVKGDGFDHAVDALRYLIQNLDQPTRAAAGSYV